MPDIKKTDLEGVLLIRLSCFKDHRGVYLETYNEKAYKKAGIRVKFKQDDYSMSKKNVLRGIHGDNETWKLITCPYGEIYLVIVDCRKSSSNFSKWWSFVISDENNMQVLVPPGYGVSHLVLSDIAIFQYKQSTYYNPRKQFTYQWNDPRFKISWPVDNPILSQRDKLGHYVTNRSKNV
jgi:dTDP-4-dehydrorhamnose 3,5-epimerase